MTQGVKTGQSQIEGCRRERRKKNIMAGKWVPQRFIMANIWNRNHTIKFVIAFIIAALVGALIP